MGVGRGRGGEGRWNLCNDHERMVGIGFFGFNIMVLEKKLGLRSYFYGSRPFNIGSMGFYLQGYKG